MSIRKPVTAKPTPKNPPKLSTQAARECYEAVMFLTAHLPHK